MHVHKHVHEYTFYIRVVVLAICAYYAHILLLTPLSLSHDGCRVSSVCEAVSIG